MKISDLKPGMFISQSIINPRGGHICMVESFNEETGEIMVLEASNPTDGLRAKTLDFSRLKFMQIIIPPKIDEIGPKMVSVAKKWIADGRHYTSNIHERHRPNAYFEDEYCIKDGVRTPVYKTKQIGLENPQPKMQFHCSSFCAKAYNKVVKNDKSLGLPMLAEPKNMHDASTVLMTPPDCFEKVTVFDAVTGNTPVENFLKPNSITLTKDVAMRIAKNDIMYRDFYKKYSEKKADYDKKGFFYKFFKGGADREEMEKIKTQMTYVRKNFDFTFESLNKSGKKAVSDYMVTAPKMKSETYLKTFCESNSFNPNSMNIKVLTDWHYVLSDSANGSVLLMDKLAKSLQSWNSVFDAVRLGNDARKSPGVESAEVKDFFKGLERGINDFLGKHNSFAKIVFEKDEAYEEKIAESEKLSAFIQLNKDRKQNLTKTKFNEWKIANEKQEKKASVGKQNHIEQTIVKQETTHTISQPVLSNSQALNISQTIV